MQSEQFQLHADIEQRHWWFVGRRRIVRSLVERLVAPAPDATIVDVGCGTGANLAELAAEYACVGIDTSAEAIRLAQGRFPNVRFIHGVAPVGLGDVLARTRLILLMDVLEHVADDRRLLADLVAAARPGTYLLVTVPADPRLWTQHDVSFGHFRRYELSGFRGLWTGLPVTPLLVSHFNARLFPLVRMVRTWTQWRGHSAGRAGTDFRLPRPSVNRCLAATFAGERLRLTHLLEGRGRAYHAGVSLMAILRREVGPVPVQPLELAPVNVSVDASAGVPIIPVAQPAY